MNWHKQLRQKLVNLILDIRVKDSIAGFLDREVGDPSTIPLPDRVIHKRRKHGKPTSVKKWGELDLEALIAVVDEQLSNRIQNKPQELKTCLKYMRHVRDYACHIEGEPNIPELINYTSFLHKFLDSIDTPAEVHNDIAELENELLTARSQEFGISGAVDADETAREQRRDRCHIVENDPFVRFDRLIDAHEEFIGRSKIIKSIHAFVAEQKSGTLILEAEPGTGKSALIAQCIRHEFVDSTPRLAYYLYHRGEGLTDPAMCLRTLYDQLVQIHGIEDAEALEPAETPRDLSDKLHRLLTKHVAPRLGENKQLIFIDSLDEANPEAELTAYQALPDNLPDGITVIASTRSIPERSVGLSRRKQIQRLNLKSPDFNSDNVSDAKAFVAARLKDKSIGPSIQDEICRVGAGNFLVLRETCRWVGEKLLPGEVADFLKRLAIEPDGPLRTIYDEFWRRLSKEHLVPVASVAGLILETQTTAHDTLALESGVIDRTGWRVGVDHLAEYLRGIAADDGRSYYRVYHESFADFLRTQVDPESRKARHDLATMCLRWRELHGELRRYAVEFGPTHLCRAERWPELDTLLTDLEFVEEKCKQRMVLGLIADYHQASQKHPGWVTATKREQQRRETLDSWSIGVMRSATQWSDEIRNAWNGEETMPASEQIARPYAFPQPPDTSRLCEILKGSRQEDLISTHVGSDAVRHLESYRSFVVRFAATLESHPGATAALAANCKTPGKLSQDAERLLVQRGKPWIEERPRLDLCAGTIPLPTIQVKASAFAISADGLYGATGDADGDLHLWDLVAGECLHHWPTPHSSEVVRVSLSVDGSRLVSAGKDGSIRDHDCRKPYLELGGLELGCEALDLDCSPEGSIIAVAGSDDCIHIIDAAPGQPLNEHELERSELNDISWVRIWPEMSRVLAEDRKGNAAVWNLDTHALVKFIPGPAVEESDDRPMGDLATNPKVMGLGQFLRLGKGGRSADGRVALHEGQHLYVDREEVEEAYFQVPAENAQLVADGQVVWGYDGYKIRGTDLLTSENIEPVVDRPRWFDPARGEPENILSRNVEEIIEHFTREQPGSDSRVLFAKLVETPPADETVALIERSSPVAHSPDFRIYIDVGPS